MRAPALLQQFRYRLQQRVVWAIVLGFTLLFAFVEGMRTAQLMSGGPLLWFRTFLTPFLFAFAYGFLSPLPWQWTGDDRCWASFLRGLSQALLWNILIVTAIVLFDAGLRAIGGYAGIRMPDGSVMRVPLRQIWGTNMILIVPFVCFVGAMIALGIRTAEAKSEAEAKLQEAQGALLRDQLSPHVLFNSLNALAELVRRDPARAEEALLDLAELYRALLQHGEQVMVPLGEERRLVQRYLGVEHLRLGDRLRMEWVWDDGIDDLRVPPFLLQPLAENALKHGIAGAPEGGDLRIEAREEPHGLRLRVANTGHAAPLVLGAGIGLRNLEARLALAYGSRASFGLRTEGSWTVAEILIPDPEPRRAR